MNSSEKLIEKVMVDTLGAGTSASESIAILGAIPAVVWGVLAGIGLLFCLFGWRLIRPINVFYEAVAGAVVGHIVATGVFAAFLEQYPWIDYIVMLLFAVVFAYLMHRFFYLTIFVTDYAIFVTAIYLIAMLFLPPNLALIGILAALLFALPPAFFFYQLIIPMQIFITVLFGSVLFGGSIALMFRLSSPALMLLIMVVALLVGIILQARIALIARKNCILKRFGDILELLGRNVGRVSQDFMEGYRKGYHLSRKHR